MIVPVCRTKSVMWAPGGNGLSEMPATRHCCDVDLPAGIGIADDGGVLPAVGDSIVRGDSGDASASTTSAVLKACADQRPEIPALLTCSWASGRAMFGESSQRDYLRVWHFRSSGHDQ